MIKYCGSCFRYENSGRAGIKKVGAFLGDYAEIGCNSVLCPGSIIGRKSTIYPLSRVRGVVPSNTIYKNQTEIVERIEN